MNRIKLLIAVLVLLFTVSAFGCGRKTDPVFSKNIIETGVKNNIID